MNLFFRVSLFISCISLAHANYPFDLFQIDASQRGKDFAVALNTAFTLASTNTIPTVATPIPAAGSNPGEVVIQTQAMPPFYYAPGITNGLIPYVQKGSSPNNSSIVFPLAAPNSTLFIFAYNPNTQKGITANTRYIVVGIEEIVTVAYRPTISPPFSPNAHFTSIYSSNVYPLYVINPIHRAQDISSIVNTFIKNPTAFFGSTIGSNSEVWIYTTLAGPYYLPQQPSTPQLSDLILPNHTSGIFPNVTAISVVSNEYLLITYQLPIGAPSNSWSAIVAADQVDQIILYPVFPPPPK